MIECDSLWSGAGVRVAADDDGASLTVVSYSHAWMFGAGSQGYSAEVLPGPFTDARVLLSQDDAGTIGFALSENEASSSGGQGIRYATRGEDGWSFELLPATSSRSLLDFELDGAGTPWVWSFESSDQTRHRARRTGPDEWTDDLLTAQPRQIHHTLSLTDNEVSFGYLEDGSDAWNLMLFQGDSGEGLGPSGQRRWYLPLSPPRPASNRRRPASVQRAATRPALACSPRTSPQPGPTTAASGSDG